MSPHDATHFFLWGALTLACVVVGLFFLRYWRTSGDRLFLFFSLAFGLLATNWLILGMRNTHQQEATYHVYLLRLAAFLLIIVGIVGKNIGRRSEGEAPRDEGTIARNETRPRRTG